MTLLTGYPEHDRWINQPSSSIVANLHKKSAAKIPNLRHPDYTKCESDWAKWRLIMESGDDFIDEYIKKFSDRESDNDFHARKSITPNPAFAKGAILEIKNSIFQRTTDITRTDGPATYLQACAGKLGGVDLNNASMNWFLGEQVIEELLAMKKVGVYIDSPIYGPTKADKGDKHPYLYRYKAEDICSWHYVNNELVSVLLRDYKYKIDDLTGLPYDIVERYRFMRLTPLGVEVMFYNDKDVVESQTLLKLTRLPFEILELNHSLLKDISNHQIALANLESSDLSFLLKAGFPLYTEQVNDLNYSNLKAAQEQYVQQLPTAASLGNGNSLAPYQTGESCAIQTTPRNQVNLGAAQGREYAKGLERPGFVSPSADVLRASMEKQEELKSDIRLLVHLALANLKPRSASAESKEKDDRGLEAGLSAIGLVLEKGERGIGESWRQYENEPSRVTINYPKRWSLKTDKEIWEEVGKLEDHRDSVPSKTYQQEITKQIVQISLGPKLSDSKLEKIYREIESAPGVTSDPDTLSQDHKDGILSDKSYGTLRGYKEEEIEQARKDRAVRVALTLKAQTSPSDPAARGAPELSTNPDASREEKEDKPVRGEAQ